MLWEASVVAGYRLAGLDGEIGTVRDFYFDDQSWVIRYLIADTGNWLTGIHIAIARAALIEVDTRRAPGEDRTRHRGQAVPHEQDRGHPLTLRCPRAPADRASISRRRRS